MKLSEFSDYHISQREFTIAISSIIIGVSALTLPATVAQETLFVDGWLSIVIGGLVSILFALLGVKVAASFPGESFLTYTSFLITRPGAIIITCIYIVSAILITAIIVQSLAEITKKYLFDQTPLEVIALVFLLVVVYAVSGLRVGLFRLNMLFLPIILGVYLFVIIFNIRWIEVDNFLPLFKTDIRGYATGVVNTSAAYLGFGIVLFYTFLIKKPKKITKSIIIGIGIPIIFYTITFIVTIGIFGNAVTQNLIFPGVEVAKKVEFPGGLFERIDIIFFIIWIMAIFNSATLFFDVAILLLRSIFTKTKKTTLIFILSPIIFYISMFPQTMNQVKIFAQINYMWGIIFTMIITVLLFIIAKVKGRFRE